MHNTTEVRSELLLEGELSQTIQYVPVVQFEIRLLSFSCKIAKLCYYGLLLLWHPHNIFNPNTILNHRKNHVVDKLPLTKTLKWDTALKTKMLEEFDKKALPTALKLCLVLDFSRWWFLAPLLLQKHWWQRAEQVQSQSSDSCSAWGDKAWQLGHTLSLTGVKSLEKPVMRQKVRLRKVSSL